MNPIGIDHAQAVLHDQEWTMKVVTAAAAALNVLCGPNPTIDGDDPATVAKHTLNSAFFNDKALKAALEEFADKGTV